MFHPQTTLNCKGKLISLEQPIVMGILNVSRNSFFDGGHYEDEQAMLQRVEKMLHEGAAIVDVGGMSSRPGAEIISEEEELRRTIPAIELIIKYFPEATISIDTIRTSVARQGVEVGASIVNDISAGKFDDQLYETVAALNVPYVLMHMQGTPGDMQRNPIYQDVVREVLDFFILEVGKLRTLGVKDIIVDPGFGFGKTVEHNYQLLSNLQVFKMLDLPILAGLSRKSMICKPLHVNPDHALNGTTALHMVALQQGARILRAHDVREAMEVIKLWQELEAVSNTVSTF